MRGYRPNWLISLRLRFDFFGGRGWVIDLSIRHLGPSVCNVRDVAGFHIKSIRLAFRI
jgi:hypothetical protein